MPSLIEIAQRLDRVESILAIQRLSADYCRGADRRDLDVFLSVWSPAAVWKVSEDLEFTGREQIAAAIGEQWRFLSRAFHWTSNAAIDLSGEIGTGRFDVDGEVQLLDGSWIAVAGEYLDSYVRVDGKWLISSRTALIYSQRPVLEAERISP